MKKIVGLVVGCSVLLILPAWGLCPPEDMTGDCIVNLQDLAALSHAWLTGDGIPNDMVAIPSGFFIMGDTFHEGDSNEQPVHIVTLDPFYMSKYEITNGQYCTFLNSALKQGLIVVEYLFVFQSASGTREMYSCHTTSTPAADPQITFSEGVFSVRTKIGRSMSNDPMVGVSWYGAVAYCNWRSQQEGREMCYDLSTWTCDFTKKGYRLPTEAEWEYAARGGLPGNRFPWGDTITHSQANYYSDSGGSYDISPTRGFHPTWNDGIVPYTSPVGTFSPNGFGLYDMAGNVWEWCNDWYGNYRSSSQTNPTGPPTSKFRVDRGGSWDRNTVFCRVSSRDHNFPYYFSDYCGFRLVLDLN
jgi:sulfatase modifying factor 1